jgi:outer membrane lipoprotein LolB
MRVGAAALATGALCLAACGSLPSHTPGGPPDETAWQSRLPALTALTDWELSGRVGIINGKDSGSGSLDWKQQGTRLSFDFRGPLGAGAVHIEGDADALWVRTSRGEDFLSTDPEHDFATRLRMPLPLLSMRYWMLGMPDPGAPYEKRVDSLGEITHLEQRGWQVDYSQYAEVQGYALPARLSLEQGGVRIKVVMDAWTLPPQAAHAVP